MALVYDGMTRRAEERCLAAWRSDLLASLAGVGTGRVLEIGAGTGHNLPHYPEAVSMLVLSEPDRFMRERLRAKLAQASAKRVVVVDAVADRLPLGDASVAAVVATLVLCSVADQGGTLAELKRVLRPGGRLVFLEHVAADAHPRRLRWQRRIEPVWKRLAGNCHLTRRTAQAITGAGFEMERLVEEDFHPATAIVRGSVRGVARKPV